LCTAAAGRNGSCLRGGYLKKEKGKAVSYTFDEQPKTNEYRQINLFESLLSDLQPDIVEVLSAFLVYGIKPFSNGFGPSLSSPASSGLRRGSDSSMRPSAKPPGCSPSTTAKRSISSSDHVGRLVTRKPRPSQQPLSTSGVFAERAYDGGLDAQPGRSVWW
jgi:hypothetical protein